MSLSDASVTIPLRDLDDLRRRAEGNERTARTLQAQLDEALQRTTKAAEIWIAVSRKALEVVGFAIANLPPESTKNWNSTQLRELAGVIDEIRENGASDEFYLQMAISCREHAAGVDECNEIRRGRRSAGPPEPSKAGQTPCPNCAGEGLKLGYEPGGNLACGQCGGLGYV